MTSKIKHIIIGSLIVAATALVAYSLLYAPRPPISTTQTPPTPTQSTLSCSKMQSNVIQAVDEYNQSQKLEWKRGGATYGPGSYINLKKFYKVLYSPGLDTCIAVVIDQSFLQEGKILTIYEESYSFYDASTYEYKDWIDTVKHGSPYLTMEDVSRKIRRFETSISSPINALGSP